MELVKKVLLTNRVENIKKLIRNMGEKMYYNDLFIEVNNLPLPLSKSEMYELIEKTQHGDTDARDRAIVHNIRFVIYIVINIFMNVEYDKRDLVSIGIIGLIKAIDTFDLSRNNEFGTYAAKCIDNEILSFLRKLKKYQNINIDSIDKIIDCDKDGFELKLNDILSDTTDITEEYEYNETCCIIRQAINGLPDRDRDIMTMYFGFRNNRTYTQDEISKKYNISQSYVSRVIIRNLAKVERKLINSGVIELSSKVKVKGLNTSMAKGRVK